ncbi:MAG: hypothetical protein CO073_01445 [Candidatus Komeilibacteria bacterium CG_4_9_14_0_8_um_filter_36_9]|uniref:Carbohydrate esterase 2 N-terminal domain-containing protein n=1 Tax=Candidatus Komeilibacteria bacterium CG_4_9_14_0_8_um_filter_36_9 TaxID=1974473 RepID=A0A2M8DRQ7_9BACT|nr:MAG: hypothetical protein CO073_01445 [Candidatus Komeilibacteria bacterium CG_4_9_14_0_8_um_filter_36_9]
MKKLFLVFLLLIAFTITAKIALADQDNGCMKLRYCTVPAPTVLKVITSDNKTIVAGVSWNETLVDIYVDDKYAGRAQMQVGSGDTGYFDFELIGSGAKDSEIYAIARNLNERDRSIKSNILNKE